MPQYNIPYIHFIKKWTTSYSRVTLQRFWKGAQSKPHLMSTNTCTCTWNLRPVSWKPRYQQQAYRTFYADNHVGFFDGCERDPQPVSVDISARIMLSWFVWSFFVWILFFPMVLTSCVHITSFPFFPIFLRERERVLTESIYPVIIHNFQNWHLNS